MRRIRRSFAVGLAAVVALVAAASAGLASEGASPPSGSVLLRLPVHFSAWSPDSGLIAGANEKAVSLRGLDGSVRRVFQRPSIGLGWPCVECPLEWTDDGTRIQFLSYDEKDRTGPATIRSIGVDRRNEAHRLLNVPIAEAAWAPGGWPLVYIPASGYELVGRKLRRVGPDPDLWRLDSLHGKPRRLFKSRTDQFEPRFSPDGTKIVFLREGKEVLSLWEMSAAGGKPRPLAGHLVGPSDAEWSPDGRSIALLTSSYRRGFHLFLLPADGGPMRKIVPEQVSPLPPAWTPDGLWITFSTYEGEIRKVHPDGTELQTIATFPGKYVTGLTWSPDGNHLAYSVTPVPTGD